VSAATAAAISFIASDDRDRSAASANPLAMPSPMPPLPPVTIATLPVRSNGPVFMAVVRLAWKFHGRWLCQIRIRPTAASAAPYPAHWIWLIMKLDAGHATTPRP